MRKLHKSHRDTKNVEPPKGQRVPLCSNGVSSRCPTLRYNHVEGKPENINRAFDVLFEEVMRRRGDPKEKLSTYQKSIYVQFGI